MTSCFQYAIALSLATFSLLATAPVPAQTNDDTAAPAYAANRAALAQDFPDATIDALQGGYFAVTPADSAPPTPAEDPLLHAHYSRTVSVYAPRHEGAVTGLIRVVTLHYEPDDRLQARLSGCLIGRLLRLYHDRFERDVKFPQLAESANIYLTARHAPDNPNVGGETRNGAIYVFGVGVDARSPLEWVRTIAHEWGHLTLPAARGYEAPERDSAGFLGERLGMSWMREEQAQRPPNAPDDGTNTVDLELYYTRQIAPLMRRWEVGGPGSHVIDGADAPAMDYYIGAVLSTDSALGSAIVGQALFAVLDVHARDFLVALRQRLADKDTVTVTAPAWAPLARGTYKVTLIEGAQSLSAGTIHVATKDWQHLLGASQFRFQRVAAKP